MLLKAATAALQSSSTPTIPAAPDTSPTDHRQPRRTADIPADAVLAHRSPPLPLSVTVANCSNEWPTVALSHNASASFHELKAGQAPGCFGNTVGYLCGLDFGHVGFLWAHNAKGLHDVLLI